VRVRDAVLHRDGARVNRVRLRYHADPLACRLKVGEGATPPGAHPRLALELTEPADSAAPGQTAALMDGDAIVGHATIE
jgi:tRNA U34 2-thiouridine synthase MnmA/TrmU